jgi:hypothetical protein
MGRSDGRELATVGAVNSNTENRSPGTQNLQQRREGFGRNGQRLRNCQAVTQPVAHRHGLLQQRGPPGAVFAHPPQRRPAQGACDSAEPCNERHPATKGGGHASHTPTG